VSFAGQLIVGLAILVGLVGVVVPLLPGAFLVLGAILVWAVVDGTATAWTVFAIAALAIGVSQVAKYVLPGRRLAAGGIPGSTVAVGGILGIVGFFVVPVVGLVLGFVLGIYAAESLRLKSLATAWPSTLTALRAVGLSMLIELFGALVAAGTWLTVVLVT